MIALLRGTVVTSDTSGVVVDVGGVGYRVATPPVFPIDAEVVIHTHTVVRESAMDLYGFATAAERDIFVLLIGLQGVGPKTALVTLSTLGAEGLASAVAGQDTKALTAVPGVGTKGAQRMLLELGSKLPSGGTVPAVNGVGHDVATEAASALVALGYSPVEARRQVAKAEGDTVEAIIRSALSSRAA